MWMTASCWRLITLRPTATPPGRRRRCSATPSCCRSACGPLRIRPRRPAARAFSSVRADRAGRVPSATRYELVDTSDMTMTTIKLLSRRLWSHVGSLAAGGAVALAALAAGVSPLPAQTIACMVGGEPITSLDIEQRSKLNFLTTRKQMPRQEVLDELINEKVKIKEAKRFGVDPSASDVDQAFAGMSQRMRLSPEQLTTTLEGQGVRPET